MASASLADALEFGEGTERPFRCEQHDDHSASASVNVLKGVWVCFTCHAKGTVNVNKAPTVAQLEQMLRPEQEVRHYRETYLELFTKPGYPGYWHTRFPDWLVMWADLGHDPITGHAVFPVRTPQSYLAGVGRRIPDDQVATAIANGDNPSRYRYPPRWSASRVLGDSDSPRGGLVVLVEGYADAVSLWEVGIPAAAVYGSALHFPQVEMLLRHKPQVVVIGMDSDRAGERGAKITASLLRETAMNVVRVEWPEKDPAACTPEVRREVIGAVGGREYGQDWTQAVANMQAAFSGKQELR